MKGAGEKQEQIPSAEVVSVAPAKKLSEALKEAERAGKRKAKDEGKQVDEATGSAAAQSTTASCPELRRARRAMRLVGGRSVDVASAANDRHVAVGGERERDRRSSFATSGVAPRSSSAVLTGECPLREPDEVVSLCYLSDRTPA
eukprot:CAMPEP_0198658176 /NCGR_PEP_ID=MMETSP1467-20131203/23382_1 /TAXON_ID=1462469 /ORGANISM="unid. sp., Strain CCMP2135" /LENGTH=144 /DNA_ID=CAMNT_0044394431 /DNA_START=8 /DNA_END=440 /DNA_ORIENTATION=-